MTFGELNVGDEFYVLSATDAHGRYRRNRYHKVAPTQAKCVNADGSGALLGHHYLIQLAREVFDVTFAIIEPVETLNHPVFS